MLVAVVDGQPRRLRLDVRHEHAPSGELVAVVEVRGARVPLALYVWRDAGGELDAEWTVGARHAVPPVIGAA